MENSKGRGLYITIILLLLVSNAVFVYLYLNKKNEVIKVSETLVTTDNARLELENLLKETESQLGVYKGQNAQLDSMITAKNEEIQAQADKIRGLLRSNQVSAAELLRVKDELDVLRYYTQKYSRQVDSLATANAVLAADLKTTKSNLNQAKEKIEDLTLDNIKKTNKLTVASKLRVDNIFITGVQNRTSGRERETTRAKRVDQLKVQFKIGDNPATEQGEKDIYLKIVSPEGVTVSTATSGGGAFDYMGEQSLYTQRQRLNFKNDQPTVTFYYARGTTEWEKGTYRCELYCEGFMIASKTFELN